MTCDKHGTVQAYWRGCHCDACRAAVAKYALDRKRAKRPLPTAVEPLPGEKWRDIPGYEGQYQASDHGRIQSLRRNVIDRNGRGILLEGALLKPIYNKLGYAHVSLPGRKPLFKVHQLVLSTFVGPRPPGMITRHLNGNPSDNQLTNLRYGTQSENNRDTVAHGTHPQARMTKCKHDHPLLGDNLRIGTDGKRVCRTCVRERQRKRRMAGAR